MRILRAGSDYGILAMKRELVSPTDEEIVHYLNGTSAAAPVITRSLGQSGPSSAMSPTPKRRTLYVPVKEYVIPKVLRNAPICCKRISAAASSPATSSFG